MKKNNPLKQIPITPKNIKDWPVYQKLYEENKVVFDNRGKLRYPHGAPVGEMVLIQVTKDGQAIYRESAEEWFDPDSPPAESFVWPE